MCAALLDIQRRFLDALHDDAASGPVDAIVGNGLDPAARMRIYRHSCDAIQGDALRTSYPAVLALVGAEFFAQTAHGYRAAHPSQSGNLQAFGACLAEYLESLPSLRRLPWLPDVARLEWMRQEAALAADDAAPAWRLRGRGADSTRPGPAVVMHPSVRLIASPHAILTIWRYAMQPTGEGLDLPATCEHVVLWRDGDEVAMAEVDPASFACIEALVRGDTLAEADRAGCRIDPDFDSAACTQSLAERGLLARRPTDPCLAET